MARSAIGAERAAAGSASLSNGGAPVRSGATETRQALTVSASYAVPENEAAGIRLSHPMITPLRVAKTTAWSGAVFALLWCCGLLAIARGQAADERRRFAIPGDSAGRSLQVFAEQAGVPILYSPQVVNGVVTQPVAGSLTPAEALERMLAGTPLAAAKSSQGVFTLYRTEHTDEPSVAAESARPAPDRSKPSPPPTTPMKSLTPRSLLSALMLTLSTSFVAAQTTAPATGGEETVVTLSPFQVDGSKDQGYRAANTLAGSRIRTELRDVAASITVLTSEFLSDVGATDARSSLLYAANVETTANFTPGSTSARGLFEDAGAAREPQSGRVRGLASPTITRNFFETGISIDTYNVSRIDINRGPNSILFGLGNPAGAVNSGLNPAMLGRRETKVTTRVGSFDQWRVEFDHNQPLIKDRLALRVAAMSQDTQFTEAEPQYNRDRRIYTTAQWKPFSRTTVKGSWERILIDSNLARPTPPVDSVSYWIEQGRPVWNPVADAGRTPPRGLGISFEGFESVQAFYERPDARQPGYAAFLEAGNRRYVNSVNKYYEVPYTQLSTLRDETYFPFRSRNLGALSTNERRQSAVNFSVEQVLFDKLALELAYNRENSRAEHYDPIRSAHRAILVDANQTRLDGSPNPNFGRPFVEGTGLGGESSDERENYRATAAYELDLRKYNKWLGRFQFSGLYEENEFARRSLTTREFLVNGPVAAIGANRGPIRNRVGYRWYLGDSVGGPTTNPVHGPDLRSFTAQWLNPANALRPETIALGTDQRNANENFSKSAIKGMGYGGAAQAYLLQDRLVLTYGKRYDEQKGANAPAPALRPDLQYAVDDASWRVGPFGPAIGGDTRTYGAVLHPLPWLSVHYNESENFQPAAGDIDIFGRTVAAPFGTGEDYGFSLNLFGNRLHTRVNWFKSAQVNNRNGSVRFITFWRLTGFETELENRLLQEGRGAEYERPPAGYPGRVDNLVETADFVAEGMEIELTFNPTRNWRISVNAAKQETVETNTGSSAKEYVALRMPFWQKFFAFNRTPTQTFAQRYDQQIRFPLANALITEGRISPQQRKWSWGAVGNYTFDESSRFKGFGVGGAVRWQDKAAVGYPIVNDPVNGPRSDIDNPFFADATTRGDVWMSYSRRIWRDKIRWKAQINVRNVFASEDLLPIGINPDGVTAVWRIPDPTTVFLTNTFTF